MPLFQTRITQLFGITYPIVQGGMRYVARARLAAAVGNAGGIGFISAHTQGSPEALLREIAVARDLTDQPFGVNLTILPELVGASPDDYVGAILESGVKFVETAGANPSKYIPAFKKAGLVVLHKCTSVRFALKAEQLGADAVSLTGFEAGGHPGEDQIPGLVLLPVAARKLKIPFIASGGFVNGAQFVAALALGADGINIGSRFMASRESPLPAPIMKRMVTASELDTRIICRSIGDSTRVMVNEYVERVLELEKAGTASKAELVDLASGPRWIAAAERGDAEGGAFAAGLSIGLIDDIPDCAEIVQRIVHEAEQVILNRLGPLVRP